jgi:Bacteriophage CI repressor helix-turn-helix domain
MLASNSGPAKEMIDDLEVRCILQHWLHIAALSSGDLLMNISNYITKLKTFAKVSTDAELADKLQVARQTVTSWRRRGSVPLSVELKIIDRYGPNAAFSPEFKYASTTREERVLLAFFLLIFSENADLKLLKNDNRLVEDWASAFTLNWETVRDLMRGAGFLSESSWPMISALKSAYDDGLMPEVEKSIDLWTAKLKGPK